MEEFLLSLTKQAGFQTKENGRNCIGMLFQAPVRRLDTIHKVPINNNRSMSLKAYQTPKHCTEVCSIDFTTLDSYHDHNEFIFQQDNHEINSRNTAFTLQSTGTGTCVCMHVIRQLLLDDVALWQKLSQVALFCQTTLWFYALCICNPAASMDWPHSCGRFSKYFNSWSDTVLIGEKTISPHGPFSSCS